MNLVLFLLLIVTYGDVHYIVEGVAASICG